ncbi:MAG: Maf family protein [Burkholderiales bacterium]
MAHDEPVLLLASQSPRRRQLLDQIGVLHRVLAPDPQEDAEALEAVLDGEAPVEYVQRVTQRKLDAAVQRLSRQRESDRFFLLCADTTVALHGTIYGKPRDAADAARMLGALAGATHQVLTAIAIQADDGHRRHALSQSSVTFAALSLSEIERYVDSGEPLGKAGAYAVQGRAAAFITRIEGSYSGIMGLPLHETAALLRTAGYRW